VGEQDGLQRAALLATKRSRLAETAQRCMLFVTFSTVTIYLCVRALRERGRGYASIIVPQ